MDTLYRPNTGRKSGPYRSTFIRLGDRYQRRYTVSSKVLWCNRNSFRLSLGIFFSLFFFEYKNCFRYTYSSEKKNGYSPTLKGKVPFYYRFFVRKTLPSLPSLKEGKV